MTSITAVLFDFAGVLTSSPWVALTAAGGGNLELLIGSYEEDTDHPWHQVERGEMAIADWAVAVTETGRQQGIEVDFTPLQAMLGELTLHEPILERVRTLRTEGYKLGLITNNVREGSAMWRSLVPVDELFDAVVDSSEVGMRKPNPAIYHHALELLGGVASRPGRVPRRQPRQRRRRPARRPPRHPGRGPESRRRRPRHPPRGLLTPFCVRQAPLAVLSAHRASRGQGSALWLFQVATMAA